MKKSLILFVILMIFCVLAATDGISTNDSKILTRTIPQSINFQGELKTSAGEPVNDNKDITFLIYSVETSGTALWVELQSSIEIADGLFSAELGGTSPFPIDLWDNTNLYLTFSIDGEEVLPRQKILAVPYALQAATLEGVPLSGVVQQDAGGNATIAGKMTAASFEGNGLYVEHADTDGLKVFRAGATSISYVSYLQNGLEICGANGNGIYVGYANEDGLSVYRAGSPSLYFNSTLSNGLEVIGAEGNGVFVGQADADGIRIQHAGTPNWGSYSDLSNGIEINGAEGNGVYVGFAEEDGVHVFTANKGVKIESASNNGIDIHEVGSPVDTWESSSYNGIEIDGAEGNGLCVGYAHNGAYIYEAAADGIYVRQANDDGFVAYANDDAVYAQTYNASNEWGLYSPDKVHASNVTTRSMSVHVLNTGNESLNPGDVVSIAGGYSTNVLGNDDGEPLINVIKASKDNAQAVFGVVEYKVTINEEITDLDGEDPRIEKSFGYQPGNAGKGDYLSVIVYGPADVNVSSSDMIESGDSVVAGNGSVRKVKTTEINGITIAENTGIVGKALESAHGGKMKIFVTCR